MRRTSIILIIALMSVSICASANDVHAKLAPTFFKNIANQLFKKLESDKGYIEKVFPTQEFEINDITFEPGSPLVQQHGKQLFGLNIGDKNSFKVRADVPYLRGNARIDKPVIKKIRDNIFDVSLKLKVHNYYLDIRHLWFQEMNLTSRDVDLDTSCRDELTTQKFDTFLAPLKNASREYENSLWARIDSLHLGYAKVDKTLTDKKKTLEIDVKVRFYLDNPKKSFKLISFTSNLGKKGGLYITPHLPKQNIKLPPLFIKTLRRELNDGIAVRNADGTYKTKVVCTEIDTAPIVDYVYNYKKDIVASLNEQVAGLFTVDLVKKLNEVTKEYRETSIPTAYTFKFAPEDIPEKVSDAIGNLAELQFDAKKIETNERGDLILGIDSEILIDGDYLSNRTFKVYPNDKQNYANDFEFKNVYDDFALGVSGEMFESILEKIADKISEKPRSLGLNVKIDINNYSVTDDGYLKFTPYMYGTKGDFKIFSIAFNFYVKPKIYENNKGERKLGYSLKFPTVDHVAGNLSEGKIIKYVNGVSKIVLPFKKWVADPLAMKGVKGMIEETFDDIRSAFVPTHLDPYVKLSGISPKFVQIKKSGSIVFYFNIKEIGMFNKYIKSLKNKMGLE